MRRSWDWLSALLERIQTGCRTSPVIAGLADDRLTLSNGRFLCTELWPFIKELPENIAVVREALPTQSMTAARKLLTQLADDERYYQSLFLKQAKLGGLSLEELDAMTASATAHNLKATMHKHCQTQSLDPHVNGIYAIVTAELIATVFARQALPHFERHFLNYETGFSAEEINEGLNWLRLHSATQTRHALWMRRMLNEIEPIPPKEIPLTVEEILDATLACWRCPELQRQAIVGRRTRNKFSSTAVQSVVGST